MSKKSNKLVIGVGEVFCPGVYIKSFQETTGIKMPTKAFYEDGTPIDNRDKLVRIVLTNGMITYMKEGTYIIKR